MAIEDVKASQGTVKTGLQENAVGLPGMLMQGIATIAPSFAILASFVFIVSFAGVVTPWAYLFGGVLLGLQALNASQLAKVFPSAGGWYTWIARALHPRAGFFAGVLFSVWLPPVGVLTMSYLAYTVLEPSIQAEYNVDIKWWIWVIAGMALVIYFSYQGIALSEKLLIITGSIEILIMVALALSGLASPGPGGFSWAPLNPGNFGLAGNLFLGVVFSIFAFSGWESTGPMAEESKNPRRNVPIGLVGSVIILMLYFVFVTWGYLNGIGVSKVGGIPTATAWPVATFAQRIWGGAWVFLLFALLNSAIAVSIASFNGGTRTWYGMGRSGVLPTALGKVNPKRKTPVNSIHLEVGMQGPAGFRADRKQSLGRAGTGSQLARISRCRHASRSTAAPAACTGSRVTMRSMTSAANSRAASTLPSALSRGSRRNSSSNTRLSITATVSRSVA